MNRWISIGLCLVWAALGYMLLAVVMPHFANPVVGDIVAGLVMAALLPVIVWAYLAFPVRQKPPTATSMRFTLLLLYNVPGFPPELIPESIHRIRGEINMKPSVALLGTKGTSDSLILEFRDVIQSCSRPGADIFDSSNVAMNVERIQALMAMLEQRIAHDHREPSDT